MPVTGEAIIENVVYWRSKQDLDARFNDGCIEVLNRKDLQVDILDLPPRIQPEGMNVVMMFIDGPALRASPRTLRKRLLSSVGRPQIPRTKI